MADLHVSSTTGLATSVTGRPLSIEPVTRTRWVAATLDAYRPLFERLATSLGPSAAAAAGHPSTDVDPFEDPAGDPTAAWLGNVMQFLTPMMMGMTAGSMIGHLATRSFGQYDLPIPRPPGDELMLVVPTIDAFGEEWSLPTNDLRLWVCLHEIAHHAVHRRAPRAGAGSSRSSRSSWPGSGPTPGRSRSACPTSSSIPSAVGDLQGIQQLFSDPEVLLGARRSAEQEQLLDRLDALVTVIVGYVDHVMDRIGETLVSSYGDGHRGGAPAPGRVVRRRPLRRADVRPAAYRRTATTAAPRSSTAWSSGPARTASTGCGAPRRCSPTPAEIDAPGLWLARIDLPDD